jgi:hypothetical protein
MQLLPIAMSICPQPAFDTVLAFTVCFINFRLSFAVDICIVLCACINTV